MGGEPLHDVDALPGPPVFQHLCPQGPVGGVDGYVNGEDTQVDNPLYLPGGEIGEGEVVAQQEGQAGVVVLEVEGGAHPRGHLVHKAEDAPVGAGPSPVHQVGLKLQPQVLPLGFAHPESADRPLRAFQGELQPGVVAVKLVVQHVHDGMAVDMGEGLAHPDPGPPGGTAGVH